MSFIIYKRLTKKYLPLLLSIIYVCACLILAQICTIYTYILLNWNYLKVIIISNVTWVLLKCWPYRYLGKDSKKNGLYLCKVFLEIKCTNAELVIIEHKVYMVHKIMSGVFSPILKDGGENDGIVMETREIELKDFLIFWN